MVAIESLPGGLRTPGGLHIPAHAAGALPAPPEAAPAPLRLLLVHPGADWSTADVYEGYRTAFLQLGAEAGAFNLHVRIGRAAEWLQWNWEKAGSPDPGPSHADTLYLAGQDVVTSALRGNVDWVLVYTGSYFHPDIFAMLRRAGRRVCLLLTESPYEDDAQIRVLPQVDLAFTNERTSVGKLRAVNPNVYYLPHAYDAQRHQPMTHRQGSADIAAHDVVFVGTGFEERLEALAAVDWTGIDLGLYGTYELLAEDSPLQQYIRGGVVDNAVAAELYRRSKIGLNLYRQSASYDLGAVHVRGAESMNPRALELAACGVFSVSNRRAEASEVFEGLVPTFEDPGELEGILRYWLDRPAERDVAARQLPARVRQSTFLHRATRLEAFLRDVGKEIDDRAAPIGVPHYG